MKKELTAADRVVKALSKDRLSFKDLRRATGLSHDALNDAIADVRTTRKDLMFGKFDKTYWFSNTPTWYSNQTDLSKTLPLAGRIGCVSDTHRCSVAERLDVLHAAYRTFQKLGIKHVFHCGDMTDGWFEYRGHQNFVKVHGDQPQALWAIQRYPKVEGITTYVIGGNHDDSYHKTKIDRLSLVTHGFHDRGKEVKGRDDIVYLGQYSHYVIFPQEIRMHMLHPRGSQAYAMSYQQQKRSENMPKNERPDIQISGHYHTYTHICLDGTHLVALPGMQDETEFFKRLGFARSIGYTVIEYEIEKGKLVSFAPRVYMEE